MKQSKKYQGIFPAFYACYDEKGEIDGSKVRLLARHLKNKGVQGLYVGGSSGECIYQSVEDRKLVLENVIAEVKGELRIITHVACNNTRDSVELAKHAESLGVDAIAAIPPIYFKLPDYAIIDYWNTISAAAPKTDFFIYNIPQLAGVALTPAMVETMKKENPRLAGVKNSSMPTLDIWQFKEIGGEDFTIFNGPDEQYVSGRIMGADAGIGGTYAVMPELYLKAEELFSAGKVNEARRVQSDINRIILKMASCRGNLYSVMKEILRRRENIDIGDVRAPLPSWTEEDEEKIRLAVKWIDEAVAKLKN